MTSKLQYVISAKHVHFMSVFFDQLQYAVECCSYIVNCTFRQKLANINETVQKIVKLFSSLQLLILFYILQNNIWGDSQLVHNSPHHLPNGGSSLPRTTKLPPGFENRNQPQFEVCRFHYIYTWSMVIPVTMSTARMLVYKYTCRFMFNLKKSGVYHDLFVFSLQLIL